MRVIVIELKSIYVRLKEKETSYEIRTRTFMLRRQTLYHSAKDVLALEMFIICPVLILFALLLYNNNY